MYIILSIKEYLPGSLYDLLFQIRHRHTFKLINTLKGNVNADYSTFKEVHTNDWTDKEYNEKFFENVKGVIYYDSEDYSGVDDNRIPVIIRVYLKEHANHDLKFYNLFNREVLAKFLKYKEKIA